MLVVSTNIPTPYRVSFFNELNISCMEKGVELLVLYCAHTEPNRNWTINSDDHKYKYKILKGFHPSVFNMYPHINVSIIYYLLKYKPTWLIIAGSWNTPTMILANLFGLSKIKIFWSEGHENSVLHKSGIISLIRKFIVKQFKIFAVPNVESQKYLENEINEKRKFIYLPNTIDNNFFSTISVERNEARKTFNILNDEKVFVQISQLSERKGVKELVESYSNLEQSEIQRSKLLIAGTGNLFSTLNNLIAEKGLTDKVILLGNLDKLQIRNLLAASDIFILNTKLDPNPLTGIEASFMCKPLLYSVKAGNFNQLLIKNVNGYAIDPFDSKSLTKGMKIFIYLDILKINKMGQNSFDNVKVQFDQRTVASQLVNQLLAL